MKKDYTHISILIDESGSMRNIRETVISGINNFLKDQKLLPGHATVSLVKFASEHTISFLGKNLSEIDEFYSYNPNGNTALNDSLMFLIEETGKWLSLMKEDERPENVLFVVFTDGMENSSHKYKLSDVRRSIKHQEEKYSWKFLFLGANMDAQAVGGSYGMVGLDFAANIEGAAAAMNYTSHYVESVRGGDVKKQKDLLSVKNVNEANLKTRKSK